MRYLIIMAMVFLLPVAAESQKLINAKAPDFTLPDQRDHQVSLHQLEGKVIARVASDKEGMKENPAWRKTIADRYGERVFIQGIADVRKVPFFLKGSYKRDFQKNPDSIILDWKGEIFNAYGLAEDVSNIVLIDKKGYVHYLHSGSAEPGAVDDLFREIDRCLE
jgi:predicted transcriptional regulator